MKKFEKWSPKGLIFGKKLQLDNVKYDYKYFLELVFTDDDDTQKMLVRFDRPIGFRIFEEDHRVNSVKNYPVKTYDWCLFKSEDNAFLEWVENESSYENLEMILYSIITMNEVIDIVMTKMDRVEILKL